MNNTEYQYYMNISVPDKVGRWDCFKFKNFYGTINDRHLFTGKFDSDKEGFDLSPYVVSILLPFILVKARDDKERKLYQIVLHDIDNEISLYKIASAIGFKSNVEFSMRRLRSIVNKEHREYYKEVNNL